MNFLEIELPSNRKFGTFFTFVFAATAAYLGYLGNLTWAYVFIAVASAFLLATLLHSDVLLPLNKLWMGFGLLLGRVVSPIVLGVIFFGLFTPYALIMKIFGRDELRLNIKKVETHWKSRSQTIPQTDFTKQF